MFNSVSDTLQIQDSWFGAHLTHYKYKTAGSALISHIANTRQLVRRSSDTLQIQDRWFGAHQLYVLSNQAVI